MGFLDLCTLENERTLSCIYRPVSLTCVPCKLLEHIMCSNIMAHLDNITVNQAGNMLLRKRNSCGNQLTMIINSWSKTLVNKGQVDTFILVSWVRCGA